MALDHTRRGYTAARPLAEVSPILTPTWPGDAVGQIISFLQRRAGFIAGVGETRYFPFSAICRLIMKYPGSETEWQGTGFYISNGLILTAGHNLLDNGNLASSIRVEPGRNEGFSFPAFSVGPDALEVHPRFRNGGEDGFDLGIIHASAPPPNGVHFQLANYSPVPETPLAVCGYGFNSTVTDDKQHLDIDRIRRLSEQNEMVEYNLQTLGGNSGSPAFIDFTNNRSGGYDPSALLVIGVHEGGSDSTHNRAVLLTPEKIDWAVAGGRAALAGTHSWRARSFGGGGGAAAQRSLGGLPLVTRPRNVMGGLPLLPAHPGAQAGARLPAPAPSRAMSHARPFARSWIVVDTTAGSGGMSDDVRTFGHPTHDLSGKTTLRVAVPNLPDGGSVAWNIPDADDQRLVTFETGGGTSASASGTTVHLRALDAGVAHVDCMVRDAGGSTVESNKYLVSAPQFVFVALDPSVSSFFAGLGLGSREADIIDEMKTVARAAFADVNIRFVFPGDTLPGHLGLGSDPAMPGGVLVDPAVYYAEIIADEAIPDPERSRNEGATMPYRATSMGRHHGPGEMDAPLHQHSLSRSLLHRYRLIGEVNAVETAVAGGGLSASDMDLVATMYGRLLGENLAHEVGHFAHGAFSPHTAGGLTEAGTGRTFAERTGMAPGGGAGPILVDNGRGNINALSATARRRFEDVLPVHPPLDIAAERSRGRVGSFALSRKRPRTRSFSGYPQDSQEFPLPATTQGLGWRNARTLSGETVHLPGATVLEGGTAQAFIWGVEAAARAALSQNPALLLLSYFVSISDILDKCDQYNITLGFGPSVGYGTGGGVSFGFGIVFAPGRRIGFYGSRSRIMGWIASAGASAQLTVVRGDHHAFGGESRMIGVSVATIGWFDEGLLDVPISAHKIYTPAGAELGYTFEVGISVGVPVASLIELYGQQAETSTSFSYRTAPRGRAFGTEAAGQMAELREGMIAEAIAGGSSPQEAQAFVDSLFP